MAVMEGKITEAQKGREVISTLSLERLVLNSTVMLLRTPCMSDSSLLGLISVEQSPVNIRAGALWGMLRLPLIF